MGVVAYEQTRGITRGIKRGFPLDFTRLLFVAGPSLTVAVTISLAGQTPKHA